MSNSAAAETRPHKKRKTSPPPPSSSSSPLSSLPYDMVLNCLARVSRSDQLALSVVSKNYRSLMASPELYKTRSLLGCTENCVYVCLLTPLDPTPRWFILHKGKTTNRLLRPIPSVPSQPPEGSSVVALDQKIYVIGGRVKGNVTRAVRVMDCRTHTWRKLPSMGVARSSFVAGIVGGKIYVFGVCRDADVDSSKWAEVFDPKTETWDSLPPIADRTIRNQYIHDSVVVKEEKVYGVGVEDDTFYYSPSEGKWGRGITPPRIGNKRDWCVVDEKLILSIDRYGNLCWSETDKLECEGTEFWKEVKGLGSLNETLCSSRLVQFDTKFEAIWESYKITIGRTKKLVELLPGARLSSISGSNIVLFWDVIVGSRLEIWCAEISLERRCQGAEIWGNTEWSNAVMTVDPFLHHYKVGDFGLARWQPDGELGVETRVIGTFGYLAPEYAQSGQITEKADVYSFGVVLAELVTGRKAINITRPKGQQCLTEWARPLLEEYAVEELIDPRLGDRFIESEVICMLHAASLCIRRDPHLRPRMSQVLRILEGDMIMDGNYASTQGSEAGNRSGRFWSDHYSSQLKNDRCGSDRFSTRLSIETPRVALRERERGQRLNKQY